MSAQSLTDQEILQYFGNYPGYRGWSLESAKQDFNATRGAGKQGNMGSSSNSSPTSNIADQLLKSVDEQIKQEKTFLEKYTKDNPFVFDEAAAKKSAQAEYEPYYTELLDDYVKNIDLKRQTTQDEQQLSQTLYKLDNQSRTRAYDRAVGQAEEGFAGNGMFFSGIKDRTTGQQQVEYNADQTRADTQYQAGQSSLNRQLEGYDLAQSQQTRDIGREQQASIESGTLQRKQEAQTQYYTPLTQAYFRQFPSSSGGALSGYLPPEYLRY